jgi:outer membrane putative beta-barrel porin/alpha-amylase
MGRARRGRLAVAAWLIGLALAAAAAPQDLEPRAYSSAPVGVQFVILGGGHSSGDLVFDPSLPIEDAQASIDFALLAYARTFSLFGRLGKVAAVLPWFDGKAEGLVAGMPAERILVGMGDPRLAVTWLFYGTPALSPAAFAARGPSPTAAGLTLTLGVPAGEYDPERLLNLGTNRWMLKTEAGASRRIGRWWLEAAAAVSLFTDNDEFQRTAVREQAPIYSLQTHLVWEPRPRLWMALDGTYYWGGQVEIDGTPRGTELGNSRVGLTSSLPVARRHSLKLSVTKGLSTRTGTDFETVGLAWQWMLMPSG